MIMCMLGTRIFGYLSGIMPIEQIGVMTMIASAGSHMIVVVSSDVTTRFLAFLVFEACVGIYFPMIGTLKGEIVPEDMRSTIYNIYRLPLNVAVLLPLMLNLSITLTFILTTSILLLAGASSFALMNMRAYEQESGGATAKQDPQELEMVVGKDDDV